MLLIAACFCLSWLMVYTHTPRAAHVRALRPSRTVSLSHLFTALLTAIYALFFPQLHYPLY